MEAILKELTLAIDKGEWGKVKWENFWNRYIVFWIACGQQSGKVIHQQDSVASGERLFSR